MINETGAACNSQCDKTPPKLTAARTWKAELKFIIWCKRPRRCQNISLYCVPHTHKNMAHNHSKPHLGAHFRSRKNFKPSLFCRKKNLIIVYHNSSTFQIKKGPRVALYDMVFLWPWRTQFCFVLQPQKNPHQITWLKKLISVFSCSGVNHKKKKIPYYPPSIKFLHYYYIHPPLLHTVASFHIVYNGYWYCTSSWLN